jgi:hypothetical protein
VNDLDGIWELERTGGVLPSLRGVTKWIEGNRGETRVGGLRVPFRVDGLELRYPGGLLVDTLVRRSDGAYDGTATFLGQRYGTFCMRRPG